MFNKIVVNQDLNRNKDIFGKNLYFFKEKDFIFYALYKKN